MNAIEEFFVIDEVGLGHKSYQLSVVSYQLFNRQSAIDNPQSLDSSYKPSWVQHPLWVERFLQSLH